MYAYIDIIIMWVMIAALTLDAWKFHKGAAVLLIPYWMWVTFASFLNLAIIILN